MEGLVCVSIILFVLNVVVYLVVYLNYKIDLKTIRKEDLAVSLEERISLTFLTVTVPSLIGILI